MRYLSYRTEKYLTGGALALLLASAIVGPVLAYPFGTSIGYTVGVHPHGVAAVDVNGDGKTDLISANTSSSSVSVLLGNGDGTFQTPASFAIQERPKFVVSGDFNADGKVDLAAVNETSSTISVLLGNGDGTFQASLNSPAGCIAPHELTVGDLNGDNKLDAVIPCWNGDTVGVLFGLGNGLFQAPVSYYSGSGPHSAVIADFNKDGKNDFAVANFFNNNLSVAIGNGTGGFAAPVKYDTGTQPHFIRSADVNKDGNLDLFTANDGSNNVSVLIGTGAGTFLNAVNFPVGTTPESITSGDVDGDGNLDLMTANSGSNNISVILGNGAGSFSSPTHYAVGLTPYQAILAQLDGDGKLDAAVANYGADNISVLRSTTANPIPPGTTYLSDRAWTSATNGYGPVERDRSNGDIGATDGGPITLNGTPYTKGLGVHANAEIKYSISGCTAFETDMGLDDEVGSNGSVIFQVWLDGVNAYDSGIMTGAAAAKMVNLSVTGKSELRLVVTDAGDGNAYDHADWAGARITCGTDITAPTVTSTSPTSGATAVAPNAAVSATFSEAMQSASLTTTTVALVKQGTSTSVPAAVSYNGTTRVVTLTPSSALATGSVYTATIKGGSSGAKDAAGNALAADYVWSFTTDTITPGYLADRTWTSATNGWGPVEKNRANGDQAAGDGGALTLNGVVYAKGLGVHANADIRYDVSGCNSFTSDIGVDDEVGNNGSVIFQIWLNGVKQYDSGIMTGATATKTATVSLNNSSELRLVVTDAGDGMDFDHADWAGAQVTCGSDTAAPTVTANSPASGATGVATNSIITATFSEGMLPSSLTTTAVQLVKQGSATPVAAAISYDAATKVVTLTPSAVLSTSSNYTATIKGGSGGVTDLAGNPLGADYSWTFTTAASITSYLSDRTATSATNGWGPVEKDRANGDLAAGDGAVLTLNGVTFAKGLGVHAASDVRYPISGCSSFSTSMGVDDEVGNNGSVIFQVWVDGVKQYDSGIMTGATATKVTTVTLTGKSELRLVVTNAGDDMNFDHADWAGAQITCGS